MNLICQMHYNYVPYTSIICMTIDFQSAMNSANNLFSDNYGFLLTDSSGETMYQYTSLTEQYTISEISPDILLNDKRSDYITETERLSNFGWTAFLYRPASSVSAAAINITYIVLAMILLCIALIFFVSTLLSKIIVSPIEKLSSSMEQVEQGNYEIEILQSQINPHFLYNSLSLINSKAIVAGQNDISQMARLLSTFYRTMLNKGQQITTIASELENTKSYIAIQQMMHSQSFDVIYDIDESILEYPIPNLLIQPLAENAIIHGLDHRELPGKAILSVSCYQENQDIIFKIMDNGCGMTAEECEQILTKDSKGYGVKNVHQRIQLYYGTDYGLTFHSTKGMGTYVLLTINKN